ncbi:hypothetical protein RRG08_005549 [Elysia crispata]|uniref:Uncharacterized protein n=1 Tax=Elysia crispata TaxID=231223 RepID=A0AAE1ALK7_9GAST|nr:hypothetical protein RRG08_005549 [Elysia crispata]
MPRPPATPKPLTHLQFHLDIARSLIKGSSRKRSYREVTAAAGWTVQGTSVEHHRVHLAGRKRQCYQCRQRDVHTASSKRPETSFGCIL